MRVLVELDGSEHSKNALIEAIKIAKKFSGSAKVITVFEQGMDKKAEKILREAEAFSKIEGVDCSFASILGSNPARALGEHG